MNNLVQNNKKVPWNLVRNYEKLAPNLVQNNKKVPWNLVRNVFTMLYLCLILFYEGDRIYGYDIFQKKNRPKVIGMV